VLGLGGSVDLSSKLRGEKWNGRACHGICAVFLTWMHETTIIERRKEKFNPIEYATFSQSKQITLTPALDHQYQPNQKENFKLSLYFPPNTMPLPPSPGPPNPGLPKQTLKNKSSPLLEGVNFGSAQSGLPNPISISLIFVLSGVRGPYPVPA
jgi:hypothetical protein